MHNKLHDKVLNEYRKGRNTGYRKDNKGCRKGKKGYRKGSKRYRKGSKGYRKGRKTLIIAVGFRIKAL